MEILVCIKRVPMVGSAIVLTEDSMDIDTRRLGFQLSPHEENAVEAAVQLVEEHGGTVTLLSLGKHVLMSYLTPEYAVEGTKLLVEYLGEQYPVTVARVGNAPLFDVANDRIMG